MRGLADQSFCYTMEVQKPQRSRKISISGIAQSSSSAVGFNESQALHTLSQQVIKSSHKNSSRQWKDRPRHRRRASQPASSFLFSSADASPSLSEDSDFYSPYDDSSEDDDESKGNSLEYVSSSVVSYYFAHLILLSPARPVHFLALRIGFTSPSIVIVFKSAGGARTQILPAFSARCTFLQ